MADSFTNRTSVVLHAIAITAVLAAVSGHIQLGTAGASSSSSFQSVANQATIAPTYSTRH